MPDVAEAVAESPKAPAAAAKMGEMFRQKLSGAEKPTVAAPVEKGTERTQETKGTDKPVVQSAKPETPIVTPPTAAKKGPELNFKALNEEFDKFRATAESRIKEMEAQRQKERDEWTNELTTTKSELQKKQEFLDQFNLERNPSFKAAFDEKIAESVGLAKRAAGKELAAKVDAIFRMPPGEWRDSAFKELRGEVEDELDRSRLIKAYDALEETQADREKQLSKSGENLAKLKHLDEENALQQRLESKRHREALYNDSLLKAEALFPDLKQIEGNTEHNALVNEDRQRLRDWLTGDLSNVDISNLSIYAMKGMRAIQTDEAKDEMIGKLQAQIQKMTAAQPGLTSATGEKARSSDGEKPDSNRILSRFHKAREQGVPVES